MNKLVKNTLLMAISFAIIGAGLTAADATIAQSLGFPEALVADLASNSAAWMGTFFGMFGAASVLVPAAVGKITGLGSSAHEHEKAPQVQITQGKGVPVKLGHAVHLEPQADTPFPGLQMDAESDYAVKIIAERSNGVEKHL